MKIFTGSGKLPISSSVYTEAKQSLSKFAASIESVITSPIQSTRGPTLSFVLVLDLVYAKKDFGAFLYSQQVFSQSTVWPFSLHSGLYCIGICISTRCFLDLIVNFLYKLTSL